MAATRFPQLSLLPTMRLVLHRADSVEVPPRGVGRVQHVLSRALCHFREFPVPAGPKASVRRAALELRIREWSPFADTGFVIHSQGDRAGVWIWDRLRLNAELRRNGLPERAAILPEALLHPPGETGLRLVETLDGVEAQYWDRGNLRASRWWPQIPDAREWCLFQRGASVPPEMQSAELPQVKPQEWQARSWLVSFSIAGQSINAATLDRALRIAGGGLAAGLLFFAAQYAHVAFDLATVHSELSRLSEEGKPILEDKAATEQALGDIRLLQSLNPYPPQLFLMARVTERLPEIGVQITDWQYQSGQLLVTIEVTDQLDTAFLVQNLQETGAFTQVSVERSETENQFRIKLQVKALSA